MTRIFTLTVLVSAALLFFVEPLVGKLLLPLAGMGTVVVWLVCFAVTHGDGATPVLEAAYWVLPKPADYNLILASALRADDYFRPVVDRGQLDTLGRWSPELSLATGLEAAGVLFWFAGRRFSQMDH